MKTYSQETKDIRFRDIVLIIVRANLIINIWIMLLAISMLALTKRVYVVGWFLLILFFGYILSFSLHEYMHIWCMRRNGIKNVEIEITLLKFSIKTYEKLEGCKLVITAMSGPIVCFFVGVVIELLGKWIGNRFLEFGSVLYLLQIVNILPFWGDGKMIIKGVLTL